MHHGHAQPARPGIFSLFRLDRDTGKQYHLVCVRKKHRKTLEAIFSNPTPANIKWDDVQSLFEACGHLEERKGSRVAVHIGDTVAIFHRPHPEKEVDKGAVGSIRRFLQEVGLKP